MKKTVKRVRVAYSPGPTIFIDFDDGTEAVFADRDDSDIPNAIAAICEGLGLTATYLDMSLMVFEKK